MRLLITRHGQTLWNLERRYQGQSDSELTEEGVRQARLLRRRLTDERIDAVYCSDLRRAWRTAELAIGDRGLAVVRDSAWREKAYGVWEGLTRAEVAARYPEQWQPRDTDRASAAPPGGESLRDVQRRVVAAISALRQRHRDDTVLVVTHAVPLRVLACTLHDDDLATSQRPHLTNCSLSCVRWRDGELAPAIECWDDNTHLEMAPGASR